MRRKLASVAACVLIAALLSGCGGIGAAVLSRMESRLDQVSRKMALTGGSTHFSQMEYTRPDMDALRDTLDMAIVLSAGRDLDALVDAIFNYYDAYDWFYTSYCLADIHYSMDMTDSYWEEEYYFCGENTAMVDAGLEELYYALAKSPLRSELETEEYFGEGYFESYDTQNKWDQAFTALLEQETDLENQYYSLLSEAGEYRSGTQQWYDAYADQLARLLLELVKVRREMAACWGYDDFTQFAWDFYYYRDYTPEQMESYMTAIAQTLVPLYREMAASDVWDGAYDASSEAQTFSFLKTAAGNMGAVPAEAFAAMEEQGLYDIAYGPNKYATSFEIYLTSYQVPFLFVCPEEQVYDRLTFAHEFGHFCNDYASQGSMAGVDVSEVFSQGMEYLALCYGEDTAVLERIKLADSLSTYVEQSAYATFEHRLYALPEEELTVENIYSLYDQVALEFGFDSIGYDPREFVTISHFYTNPLYIDSYVVSNDAAMELYQLEKQEPGLGLACFTGSLDTTQGYFLAYLEEAGLRSPFAPGRLDAAADLFRQELFG